MDLPERFKGNIRSRLGENRIIYQPYTKEQIEEILSARVGPIFKRDALKCVSSKIAALSGDIRRALKICSKATDYCK